jgi:hypothetical protein
VAVRLRSASVGGEGARHGLGREGSILNGLALTGSAPVGGSTRNCFENVVRQELLAGPEQLPLLEPDVVAQALCEGARRALVARTGSFDAAAQEGMVLDSPVDKGRRPSAPESRQQQVLLYPEVWLKLADKMPAEVSSVGVRPCAFVRDQGPRQHERVMVVR